ncbi:hypothetical protein [Streptomyces canus]|uniref:hypothetical protein n=1 Tax=Streptomyces canus TaxID=58343 RepID=UPI00382155E0
MRIFLDAATGPPTILLTAALVVVVCFWLLAAAGVTHADSFDTDMNLRPWRLDGVPVSVAFSMLTLIAWLLSVGTTVVLGMVVPLRTTGGLLRPAVSAGALVVAWAATRLIVRALRPLVPDEPASGDAARPQDRAL